MSRPLLFALQILFLLSPCALAKDVRPLPEDLQFFETRIRPILVEHCHECHSADAKEVGGKLLLDTRDGTLKGGEAGPAVIAGKPQDSPIIQAMRYDGIEMPPDKPLPETVVNDFVEWVRRGAPDPRTSGVAAADTGSHDEESLWAFRPPKKPPVPAVNDTAWPRDDIDRFVLANIEAAGLQPTSDADPRALIRRLFVDLIGLPPSFEEVEVYATACETDRATATAALVDDLLARPQFGERWGTTLAGRRSLW